MDSGRPRKSRSSKSSARSSSGDVPTGDNASVSSDAETGPSGETSSNSGSTSSSKGKKASPSKSPRNSEEQGEMLTKDKAEQAQRMLETVERVLAHISDNGLGGSAALEYILVHSVDVQRIATLQQLHNHVDAHDAEDTARALRCVLDRAQSLNPKVQVAAADGIQRILPALPESMCRPLVDSIAPLISRREDTPVSTPRKPTLSPGDSPQAGPVADGVVSPGSLGATETDSHALSADVLLLPESAAVTEARSAWKELFHAVLRRIPSVEVEGVLQQHVDWRMQPAAPSTEKIFGAETLQVLLDKNPEVGTLMLRYLIGLSCDESTPVRLAAVRKMPVLFDVVLPVAIREQLFMPLLMLLADTKLAVACAAFETAIAMPKCVGTAFTRDVLKPVLKQFITNAPDEVLQTTTRNYGKLVWNLRDAFEPLPQAFVEAARASPIKASMRRGKSLSKQSTAEMSAAGHSPRSTPLAPPPYDAGLSLSSMPSTSFSPQQSMRAASMAANAPSFGQLAAQFADNDWIFFFAEFARQCASQDAAIRRECAFNAPALMASVPMELRNEMFACVSALAKDSAPKVRISVAAGFHELCSFAADPVQQILPIVTALAADTNVLVKEHLFANITDIFSTVKRALPSAQKADTFFTSMTPLVIAYEKEIHTNWRKVAALLTHMQHFADWFSPNDLFAKYVPLLVSHLVSGATALNKRVCRTIALFLRRSFATLEDCVRVLIAVKNMTAVLARNKAAAGRMGFIALFSEMAQHFSQEFVKAFLLPALAQLAADKVSNVRCALARAVPPLLSYPLLRGPLEKTVVAALQEDKDPDVRRCIADPLAVSMDSLVGYSDSRNARLLKEEGPQLLSSEAIKKAGEALEAAKEKSAPPVIPAANPGPTRPKKR